MRASVCGSQLGALWGTYGEPNAIDNMRDLAVLRRMPARCLRATPRPMWRQPTSHTALTSHEPVSEGSSTRLVANTEHAA